MSRLMVWMSYMPWEISAASNWVLNESCFAWVSRWLYILRWWPRHSLSTSFFYWYLHSNFLLDLFSFTSHYTDVKICTIASQITSLTIVYSTDYSDADQRKHQSSASVAFVRGIHRGPVSSPHKWPVTRELFPFDDVITFKCIPWGICPKDCNTWLIKGMFINNNCWHWIISFHRRFWILGSKSIKCFRNITTENWYIQRRPVSVCYCSLTAPGDWNDKSNIKAKWSESTDWSDFSPVTHEPFLVITMFNVFPAVCVDIVTCCDQLYWLSKAFNLFVPESDWLFTWKFKSPTFICFPVVVCK